MITVHVLSRRVGQSLFRVSLLLGVLCALPALSVRAQEPLPAGVEIDLQDQLEKGLKARLPQEFAYIRRVVDLVRTGQLPLCLVRGTFDYARKKHPYPLQYFHRALTIRAAKRGISVESLELELPISP
jgi:hypothetical protein